ncbi:MAG: hypothetical protein L0Y58_24730 [Verrucomicrobia subdivision 3 bacterium]|nr:hypothetical protein [Limisphaerales bacterium]
MSRKGLIECSFFIPIRRDRLLSDGAIHDLECWEWLEKQLFIEFEGATEAQCLHSGFYADPDTQEMVRDESKKFTVAVTRREVRSLRALLKEACRVFKQKCIYLSVAGTVEFVEGDHE